MKRPGFSWRYTLIIIGLVVLAFLVMDFNTRMGALRRLTIQKEEVATQLEGQIKTQAALQTQIGYASSDEAVEQWAYEEGSMVRDGDVPVVPVPPSESTPIPLPTTTKAATPVPNWQFWLWLFVDADRGG